MVSKAASAAATALSRLAHRAMTAEERKARARKAARRRWELYRQAKEKEGPSENTP